MLMWPALGGVIDLYTSQRFFHAFFIFFIFIILFFRPKCEFNKNYIKIVIFCFFVTSYYFLTNTINCYNFNWTDVFDIVRPIVYLIYFSFACLISLEEDELTRNINRIYIFSIISVLFSITVFIPVLAPVHDIFKVKTSNFIWTLHYYRFTGTFPFPSDFCFFLLLWAIYSILSFFLSNEVHKNLKYGLPFLILSFGIVGSGSRGGVGTLIIVLFCYFLFQTIRFKKIGFQGLLFFCLLSVALYIIGGQFNIFSKWKSLEYLGMLKEGRSDGSLNHRIIEMKLALNLFWDYFPFGFGANKMWFEDKIGPVESLYGYHLGKWGFLGILFYFTHLAYFTKAACGNFRNKLSSIQFKIFNLSYLVWIWSVPFVFGFSSSVTDRFKGPFIFYGISAYVVTHYWKIKKPY